MAPERGPALPPGHRRYYAAAPRGLEAVLEAELRALGAAHIEPRPGGAAFTGSKALGYLTCLGLATAIRVQELLTEGPVQSREEVYALAKRIPWSEYLRETDTLAVDAALREAPLRHSGDAALVVKDAVVDWFREKYGRRPDVDKDNPTVTLRLALVHGWARLYRDLSGESLHKRGYRPIQVKSPVPESLAAGLLILADSDPSTSFLDPMCGSGTFVIEEARRRLGIAPGLSRHFAFENWLDFDASALKAGQDALTARKVQTPVGPILGTDRHAGAIAIARKSAEAAGVGSVVRFEVADLESFVPPFVPETIVTNPPWGERLDDDPIGSWRALGKFVKAHARGTRLFVLSGDEAMTKHLGLRATRRFPVKSGAIDCRFLHYDVHKEAAPKV